MLPILHNGDIVTYKKIRFFRSRTNDIILIKQGAKLFTHSVIYVSANYLITKGDNNLEADKKTHPDQEFPTSEA